MLKHVCLSLWNYPHLLCLLPENHSLLDFLGLVHYKISTPRSLQSHEHQDITQADTRSIQPIPHLTTPTTPHRIRQVATCERRAPG